MTGQNLKDLTRRSSDNNVKNVRNGECFGI